MQKEEFYLCLLPRSLFFAALVAFWAQKETQIMVDRSKQVAINSPVIASKTLEEGLQEGYLNIIYMTSL